MRPNIHIRELMPELHREPINVRTSHQDIRDLQEWACGTVNGAGFKFGFSAMVSERFLYVFWVN